MTNIYKCYIFNNSNNKKNEMNNQQFDNLNRKPIRLALIKNEIKKKKT